MDTKYNMGGKKSPLKQIHLNQHNYKPKPVLFHIKGGPPAKKMKFNNDKTEESKAHKKKVSLQQHRQKLPVYQHRYKILELIKRHETLIILGETGSGKTTQIPQFIHSARLEQAGRIGITQPRRVAAVSIATRVALEISNGNTVGDLVGYTVRFEDVTSKQTKIKYLTDGMMLREAMADNLLKEYNVIILDEAHERTVHTDVLFGIVKQAQRRRKEQRLTPLKIILMSATMDVDHFSKFFNNCKAVYLEGRTYPVNIFFTKVPHEDYQTACVAAFFKIHREAPANHDVLIFLTGQEEIESMAHQIKTLAKDSDVEGPPLRVLTLYAAQPSTQQMAVFQPIPDNTRKVIISTNVAETSITISRIKYVIDSGMVKVRSFHPTTGLDTLKVQRSSQEQAWQRAGRAGRESEGYCYRIYTRTQFELMQKTTIPEIQRVNLSTVALQLLVLGIHVARFDFMDRPPRDSVVLAFEQLKMLGAVEDVKAGTLTEIGRKLAKFPLDPRFSKILISAHNYGCLEEALTIVALLSGEPIYINPAARREQVALARQKFKSAYGDHITLLNTYREFNNVGSSNKKSWCHEHFINLRNVLHAREIRTQLAEICKRCEIPLSSCGSSMDQVRKCLLTGLFMNVAELHKDRQYVTLDKRQTVYIHPSSVLHGQQPAFVLFTEVVQTSKCYLRGLSSIEGEWLQEIVPEYIKGYNIKYTK